ncbi:MAG TPA: LLM class F420-dependent oxidoreductase [Thermomicrobiales bacterium]|nr:LLM class F420-dependent oxidoreductase [Thermomicrobiales bacterium]
MEVSIMIEGQMGLTWPRWQRLVRAAEDLGFYGIYRSDHFTSPGDAPYDDALELWTSLTWLADNTSRITFGPLVAPVSFRHPVIMAWQASAVSALSGGRLRLGIGAGWQEREHEAFGFDLLPTKQRLDRFEEAIQVIKMLCSSSTPVSFEGEYYRLKDAMLSPRSPHADGPPIVIGGNGPKRTLPLVAEYADEWNASGLNNADFANRMEILDGLLEEKGRDPKSVKRTLMTGGLVGKTDEEVREKASGFGMYDLDRLRQRDAVFGTPDEIVENLGKKAEIGVQGVMLQWLNPDDISGLELIAEKVLPQLK